MKLHEIVDTSFQSRLDDKKRYDYTNKQKRLEIIAEHTFR